MQCSGLKRCACGEHPNSQVYKFSEVAGEPHAGAGNYLANDEQGPRTTHAGFVEYVLSTF